MLISTYFFQEAFGNFQELEDRITYVATKVVHLGDQLESSNNRRARDFEAETLMRYLAEFYVGPKPTSIVFNDPGQVIIRYSITNFFSFNLIHPIVIIIFSSSILVGNC